MRIVWLFSLLIVALPVAHGQQKNAPERQQIVNEVGKNFSQASVQTFDERYEGVKGSPLLLDQWAPGKVTLRDGKVFANVELKYDLYRDELVVKHPYDHAVIPDKHTIARFSLRAEQPNDSLNFIQVDYLPNYRNFPPNHFAQVLYGNLSDPTTSTLLAVHDKKLIKANFEGAYSANRPYDEFSQTMTSYYLVKPDGRSYKLKPKIKSIRRLLSDKKAAVSAFLDKESINPENPNDLAQLVKYYDQQ